MGLRPKQLKQKIDRLEKQLAAAELRWLKADWAREGAVLRLEIVRDWLTGLRKSRLLRWIVGNGPTLRGVEWPNEAWLEGAIGHRRELCEARGAESYRRLVLRLLDQLIRTSSDPAAIRDRLELLKFLRQEVSSISVHGSGPPRDLIDILRRRSEVTRRWFEGLVGA